MKNPLLSIAIALSVIFAAFFAGSSRAETKPRRPVWEYKTLDVPLFHSQGVLDPLGNDGWELVGVGVSPQNSSLSQTRLYFKRAKE